MARSETETSVLIIGNDARCDAYGWLMHRAGVKVYTLGGNAGTIRWGRNLDFDPTIDNICRFAHDEKTGLVLPSSENWFAKGIINALREGGQNGFGPTQEAARLESSKKYSTRLMESHAIPHPQSFIAYTYGQALEFARTLPWKGAAVKGDNLAGGKAVEMVSTPEQAEASVKNILVENKYGYHQGVVFQEWVYGREVTVIALVDGAFDENGNPVLKYFPITQDHKDLEEGNRGPKTGGMGAYGPVTFVSQDEKCIIHNQIMVPTLKALRDEGQPFSGALYAGLMLTEDGPKVLEFNVRFGDPEMQALAMLITKRTNFYNLLLSCTNGTLSKQNLHFYENQSAVATVLAAEGYPEKPVTGGIVYTDEEYAKDRKVQLFHADTRSEDSVAFVNGGRVLTVGARRRSLVAARNVVNEFIQYGGAAFTNMQYRRDIAAYAN